MPLSEPETEIQSTDSIRQNHPPRRPNTLSRREGPTISISPAPRLRHRNRDNSRDSYPTHAQSQRSRNTAIRQSRPQGREPPRSQQELRQVFYEREVEQYETRTAQNIARGLSPTHRNPRPQLPSTDTSPETRERDNISRRAQRSPSLSLSPLVRHRQIDHYYRRLFIYAILLIREENRDISVEEAWQLVLTKLYASHRFSDEREVEFAWSEGFEESRAELLPQLIEGSLNAAYLQAALLHLRR